MDARLVVVQTPRLWLRCMTPDDAAHAYALNHDAQVLQYTGDEPFASIAEARRFLQAYPDYIRYGYGRWAVVRRADDAFLGWCGLKFHPHTAETDIGFRLMRACWNQGYATEAARACLQYGFGQLGLCSIMAQVMQANAASIAVLEKIGMTRQREQLFDGKVPGYRYVINASAGNQAITAATP